MRRLNVVLLCLSVWVLHFALWIILAHSRSEPLSELLSHWDSGWYNKIITLGYSAESYAFMPLYPQTIKLLHSFVPEMSIPLLGTVFSALCFFVGVALLTSRRANMLQLQRYRLLPMNRMGWWLFFLAPASYIFHSHHTESLFFLCTVLGVCYLTRNKLFFSAVFAGLAALTRIQGFVFVFALALLWLEYTRSKKNAFDFAVVAFIIASFYPLYQWYVVGDPLYFIRAQGQWTQDVGVKILIWIKALWLGNEWQPKTIGSVFHSLFFFVCVIYSFRLLRYSVSIALYCALSLFCMFPQGEFVDTFRYSAVLFPIYFLAGDDLARVPKPIRLSMLMVYAALNMAVAYSFAVGRWAY